MSTRTLRSHARLGWVMLVLVAAAWLAFRIAQPRPRLPTRHDTPAAVHVPAAPPDGRMMRGVVRGHGSDEWTLRFVGGQPASIQVYGEGESRLHCLVRDAAGVVLAADTSTATRCLLHLSPRRTGAYRVVIRNTGGAANAYRLLTR